MIIIKATYQGETRVEVLRSKNFDSAAIREIFCDHKHVDYHEINYTEVGLSDLTLKEIKYVNSIISTYLDEIEDENG